MPVEKNSILIRDGQMKDAATIAVYMIRLALETEDIRLSPNAVERGVRSALSDPEKGRYFVAEFGPSVVGCLMLTREWSDWRDGWIIWIQSVYVHSEFRKQGVFKSLYAHVREWAREQGALSIRLYVDTENESAQETYKKLGMSLSNYKVMEGDVG